MSGTASIRQLRAVVDGRDPSTSLNVLVEERDSRRPVAVDPGEPGLFERLLAGVRLLLPDRGPERLALLVDRERLVCAVAGGDPIEANLQDA